MRIFRKAAFFTIFVFAASGAAFAQPPSADQPGAQAERFRAQSEREKKTFDKKAKPAKIEIEEEQPKPTPESSVSFMLKGIKITGTTIFPQEDFKPDYEPFIGNKVTFKDLDKLINAIKARYKAKGYLTTTAYIPEQTIAEGIVEIRVIEGKMGELKVEGNKYFGTDLIKRFFHSKKNEILNTIKLQRDVLRLNQNRDLQVVAVLQPGKEEGEADVLLKITEKLPWHVGGGVDNQGTRLTGKYRETVYGRSSNLTGMGDNIFVNTLFSAGTLGEMVSYSLPLGTYGTKVGFDYTYFFMEIGREYRDLNITGISEYYTPKISWEIALSELFTLNTEIGLEIKSIVKEYNGESGTNDQLRLPYVNLSMSNIDGFGGGGQTFFSPQVSFGTSGFLGSWPRGDAKASRPGTGGSFFKYEQTLSRLQRMPFESYIQARTQFQMADRDLPSSEQLQLGGESSVRGYPEGDYLCDTGASLNLDWIFPMYLIPKEYKLPRSDTPLRNQIQPVAFMDIAGGSLRSHLSGEKKEKFLMGLGGGVRINLYDKAFLKFEWAKDVGAKPTGGGGPSTFYLTIQSEV